MATAFQPAPHWNRAVPLSQESTLFDSSYTFDTDSDHANRRPSHYATTLHVDPQMDHIKRDSGRSMKSGSSASRSTSPLKAAPDGMRRPSAPISIPIPRSASQGTLEDKEAWIHRDKLARIESQELAAAGFSMPQSTRQRRDRSVSRSASRSNSGLTSSRNQSMDRISSPRHPNWEERTHAVEGASDDQESDDYDERLQEEPRPDHMYSKSMPRPSISRIPVARGSPAPLSSSVVERESPLSRGKNGTSSMNSRLGASTSSRTRSRSLGNPSMIVAEANDAQSTALPQARPRSSHLQNPSKSPSSPSLSVSSKTPSLSSTTKGKAPTKVTAGSVGRKATNSKSTQKFQSSSVSSKNNTPIRRPTSSSSKPRPTSLNRPEGDAPWLAHMYKPDPRLPPDQQLLPTHAKRMVNGHSDDAEGSPSSFTKDFDALDDEELARMGALPPPEPAHTPDQVSPHQTSGQKPWPVTSNKSETKSSAENVQQRASTGYKITPTIESPKPSSLRPVPAERAQSHNPTVQRVPDPDEKADGKKKKKFACCVMM